MRLADIDGAAIRGAVEQAGPRFRTMDISSAAPVRARHAIFDGDRSRHSMIGRYLSRHRDELRIEMIGPGHGNAKWRKL